MWKLKLSVIRTRCRSDRHRRELKVAALHLFFCEQWNIIWIRKVGIASSPVLDVTLLKEVSPSLLSVLSWHLDVGRNRSITSKNTSINIKLRLTKLHVYIIHFLFLKLCRNSFNQVNQSWINFLSGQGFYQYESMFPGWKKEFIKRKPEKLIFLSERASIFPLLAIVRY